MTQWEDNQLGRDIELTQVAAACGLFVIKDLHQGPLIVLWTSPHAWAKFHRGCYRSW